MRTARCLMRKIACVSLLALIVCSSAFAQHYPNQPIRLVMPAAAGSVSDVVARKLTDSVSKSLGQSVIVDNRPGANGFIAAEAVARAKPDGYNLLYASSNILCVNPALFTKLPYDPSRDFVPISLIARGYPLLVVSPRLPVKTLTEFIEYAKARPRQVTYGSPGVGTIAHLAMKLLEQLTGVEMVHVPYKNAPQILTDLMGGQIDAAIDFASVTTPHIKTGKMRALVIVGPSRKPALPDVPTAAEVGLPGFELAGWSGLMAPVGTPPEIIAALNKAMVTALKQPQFVQWISAFASEATPSTPEEFAAYIKAEIPKFTKIIKTAKIQLD